MEALQQNKQRFISLKLAKRIVVILALVFLFDFIFFPLPALAYTTEAEIIFNEEEMIIVNHLPDSINREVDWSGYYKITAYNSEVAQTDGAPCITATGFDLCQHGIEDSIATNFLPFGTKIRIPELFGDKVFIVRDRMNQRYNDYLDIWMTDKQAAKQFGVKTAKIEVLE